MFSLTCTCKRLSSQGVHYIGNIHKRQKYFDLILETPIEWDEMGLLPWDIKRSYDELRIGDRSYFLAAGRKAFVGEQAMLGD